MRMIDGDRLLRELTALSHGQVWPGWTCEGIRLLIERQPTLTPPNEWVSVEERLPDELTMVLIYSGGIYDVAGWIEDEDGKICWTHNAKPQFWRPIPGLEPPGKDNNVPTKEQNEPLTLEQLREKVGQPVWVQTPGIPKYGRWVIVAGVDTEDGQRTLYCQGDYTCRNYGRDWLAYRRPPEGEEDT